MLASRAVFSACALFVSLCLSSALADPGGPGGTPSKGIAREHAADSSGLVKGNDVKAEQARNGQNSLAHEKAAKRAGKKKTKAKVKPEAPKQQPAAK